MDSTKSRPFIDIPPISKIPLYLFLGVFVCVFSLSGVIKNIGEHSGEGLVARALLTIGSVPEIVYEIVPGSQYFLFELLIRWLFLSLIIFVLMLAVSSVRLRSGGVFLSGSSGLIVGAFVLTWVSIAVWTISWILYGIYYIGSAILEFLRTILLWPPVLYTLIGLAVLAVVIGVIASFSDILEALLDLFKALMRNLRLIPIVGAALGLIVGIGFILKQIWEYFLKAIVDAILTWLAYYVLPIFKMIFTIFLFVILGILAILALGFVLLLFGSHYAEQFSFAKSCGRSTHGAFDAGCAFGLILALIFLVSSTDPVYQATITSGWNSVMPFEIVNVTAPFFLLIPGTIGQSLQGLFSHAPLPIFDVMTVVSGLFLANCSLFMSVISGTTTQPIRGLVSFRRMPVACRLGMATAMVFIVAYLEANYGGDA
jgi:hypothetical protein